MAGRFLRRLLVRSIRGVVREPAVLGAPLALVVVAIALFGGGMGITGLASNAAQEERTAAAELTSAADLYMAAMRDRDLEKLVATMAEARKPVLVRQAQSVLGNLEQNGARIVSFKRVATYDAARGGSFNFYVAQVDMRGQQSEVPFMIAMDEDGKVVQVE